MFKRMFLSAQKRVRLKVPDAFRTLCLPGLLLLAGFNQEVQPATPPEIANSDTVRRTPFETLQRIRVFAFGGVGYAGTTSDGEVALRSVLTNNNALEIFAVILTNGSTEAKLYALCGIRKLSPADFDGEVRKLETNAPVSTMHGCIMRNERAADVLVRIRAGQYDVFSSVSR